MIEAALVQSLLAFVAGGVVGGMVCMKVVTRMWCYVVWRAGGVELLERIQLELADPVTHRVYWWGPPK